jgi:hypothetical protein
VDFGFILDSVDDVGGAEGDVEVGDIVLVEECGFMGGDADAEDADVFVFQDEMVVGFLGDGDAGGSLGVERENEEQEGCA